MNGRLVYMSEVSARREAAEIIKTDLGKLILENVQQKEKTIFYWKAIIKKAPDRITLVGCFSRSEVCHSLFPQGFPSSIQGNSYSSGLIFFYWYGIHIVNKSGFLKTQKNSVEPNDLPWRHWYAASCKYTKPTHNVRKVYYLAWLKITSFSGWRWIAYCYIFYVYFVLIFYIGINFWILL